MELDHFGEANDHNPWIDAQGRNLLFIAAQIGDPFLLENLMKYRRNFFERDNCNQNILHYACQSGNKEMVKKVLNIAISKDGLRVLLNSRDYYTGIRNTFPVRIVCYCSENTWCFVEVRRNFIDIFKKHIKKRMHIEDLHKYGRVHYRCPFPSEHEPEKDLQLYKTHMNNLAEYGSNSRADLTPLMTAILLKKKDIIPLIVKHCKSMDLTAEDRFGFTAKHHACITGDLKTLQLLEKQRPSHFIDTSCILLAHENGHQHIVNYIHGEIYVHQIKKHVQKEMNSLFHVMRELQNNPDALSPKMHQNFMFHLKTTINSIEAYNIIMKRKFEADK